MEPEAASLPPPPPRLPWDFHPALTEERLRLCARMPANARRDALAMASYELGDDPWNLRSRRADHRRVRIRFGEHCGVAREGWNAQPLPGGSGAIRHLIADGDNLELRD